jgi:hypothetical protein
MHGGRLIDGRGDPPTGRDRAAGPGGGDAQHAGERVRDGGELGDQGLAHALDRQPRSAEARPPGDEPDVDPAGPARRERRPSAPIRLEVKAPHVRPGQGGAGDRHPGAQWIGERDGCVLHVADPVAAGGRECRMGELGRAQRRDGRRARAEGHSDLTVVGAELQLPTGVTRGGRVKLHGHRARLARL